MTNTDVVILCGGLGTRLKSVVADRPKPMAEVGSRPFLDILIGHLRRSGFRRFILCTGHMSEAIEAYYHTAPSGVEIVISREPGPLGTAGAVKNAQRHIRSDPFLVANGDSFCDVDLVGFVESHLTKTATFSMVVVQATDTLDYGTVIVDADQRIVGFKEKADTRTTAYISAGLYLFSKAVLADIPAGIKTSLEYDIFPQLVGRQCYAFTGRGPVLDIGTPERLRTARHILAEAAHE